MDHHEQAPGSFAVSVRGMTAFPFAIADKILRAEPYKSFAFSRVCFPQSLHALRQTRLASNLRQKYDLPIGRPASHILTAYVHRFRATPSGRMLQ